MQIYVNYLQKNWTDLFHLAKCALNNPSSTTTEHSLLYTNYGFYPCFNELSVCLASTESAALDMEIHAALIQKTYKALNHNITATQKLQARYYD